MFVFRMKIELLNLGEGKRIGEQGFFICFIINLIYHIVISMFFSYCWIMISLKITQQLNTFQDFSFLFPQSPQKHWKQFLFISVGMNIYDWINNETKKKWLRGNISMFNRLSKVVQFCLPFVENEYVLVKA